MKKQTILIVLTGLIGVQSFAKFPEKAEYISSLLIGETIPDIEMKSPDAGILKFSSIVGEKPTVLLFLPW